MNRFMSLLGILLTANSVCWAQRVIYSSQNIHQSYQGPAIKAVRPHGTFSSTITIKYADGRTQAIPKDSIWGYENRRSQLYRYYKGSFYRVLNTDGLVRYSIQQPARWGVSNVYYFSQDYDSPLRWRRAKARRDSSQITK